MACRRFAARAVLLVLTFSVFSGYLFADANFDRLMSARQFKEAVDYADDKIPNDKRTPAFWARLGQANDAAGATEKALACYMVSWRMDQNNYAALLGIAQIYNKLGQYDNAIDMAENALKINFTAEASWEFARACIALKRPADAKKALEKVLEADANNLIANRELGNIYYDEGDYTKALPLIRRSYREKADGENAFRIGRAYIEIGVADSALVYLREAVNRKVNVSEASRFMARAHFRLRRFAETINEYSRVAVNQMEAVDHYNLGFSREQAKDAAGALTAYQAAVTAFGNDRSAPALLARAFVAKDLLSKKQAAAALNHLRFIAAADERAATVQDIYFLLADAHIEAKDNNNAVSSLERAIALNSKNIEAYARLAELYEKSGQGDRAKRTYERMMSVSPNDPNVFLALGNYNNKEKRWAEAIPHFEKSISLRRSAAASEGLAIAAFNMKNTAKALEAARAAVGIDKDAHEAHVVLARILINNKDFKNAQPHVEAICRKEPANLEFLRMLALCYENSKDQTKLAETDRMIVTADRRDVPSRLRLARFAASRNDDPTAIAMYREVAALDANNSESVRKLAELLNKSGGTRAEAITFMRRFVALNQNNAEAHRDLGDMLYEQKNLDGALESYRTAIRLDPNLKGFHKRYAEIVIARGLHNEVITALNAVIKNGDADVSTYTTLGMIHAGRKQFKEAQGMYTKALALDPTNLDALSALAASQAAAGDINAAIITYEQAVMMNKDASREYKELGDLYTRQKKDPEALRSYMRYLDKVKDDITVANTVGRLLYGQKRFADAAKYLALVKSTDPAFLSMYADALAQSGNGKEAIPILEGLRARRPPVANANEVLRALALAYENDKQSLKAGQIYAEFIAIRGVRDAEAAYKAAFLQEKDSPGEAMKIYEANTRTYPDDFRNFLRLGLMLSQKKETASRALPHLRKCIAVADSIPAIWLELAKVYGVMNNDKEELEAYQKYLRTDPQHLEANKRTGMLLMRAGDMTNAMVHLQIANTVSPNDPDVLVLLARGYMRSNRTKEAIDMLVRVKTARPNDVNVRFQLYELYVQTGQTKRANDEIKQLVEINKDTRYMLLYGESLISQNNVKEAENIADDILSADPDNIDAMLLKAKILRAGRKWSEADEIYREITEIIPNHAVAHFERAETLMLAKGSVPRAQALYNRALRADPKFALAHLGLARIARQQKNMDDYRKHLAEAQKLEPDNAQIAEEVRRAPR